MRTIKIYFNPYTGDTRLFIDEQEQLEGESRLQEFIVGQTLDKWLSPYNSSYQKWNGILPELVEYFNDDELELHFFSLPEYLDRFTTEMEKQSPMLEEKGYSPELCRLHCVECFAAEKIRKPLIRFVRNTGSRARNQDVISSFECIEEDLTNSTSAKQMREIFRRLQEAIQSEKNFCQRQESNRVRIWENAETELTRIFNWQD